MQDIKSSDEVSHIRDAIRAYILSDSFILSVCSADLYSYCSTTELFSDIDQYYVYDACTTVEAECEHMTVPFVSMRARDSVRENVVEMLSTAKLALSKFNSESTWQAIAKVRNSKTSSTNSAYNKYISGTECLRYVCDNFDINTTPSLIRDSYKKYFDICFEYQLRSHDDFIKRYLPILRSSLLSPNNNEYNSTNLERQQKQNTSNVYIYRVADGTVKYGISDIQKNLAGEHGLLDESICDFYVTKAINEKLEAKLLEQLVKIQELKNNGSTNFTSIELAALWNTFIMLRLEQNLMSRDL